ncbi:hypothetical protein PhAPEC2_243 [Escherichia phage vB_EcoM_PhAPEC2]|uniref:Uncharacterized protein n=1 Tax=Escherichia phage vB_EcoM_PhAPEC2 TaxID=1391224 RepID=A0A067ZKK2_9CAUD|nr:hypothetical protein LD34_gp147 [Escherichia phage vB_EcoM_PhAPEC2]AHV82952.1 hypothetical protein PhAPEC2_243 [Escherichia phage vB_EcoM_PhAPEC2]
MKSFKERLELLDLALSRETPESLAEKFQSYGYNYSADDIMNEVPEICWQTCYWNNDQKVQRVL